MSIQLKEAQLISKAFSREVLYDVLHHQSSDKLHEILLKSNLLDSFVDSTYAEIFESLYDNLLKVYRSEYVYKNALASKIVVGKHKLAQISYFSEFKAWDAVADVVIVNGTTTVYEIKTEYDSFSRLSAQIATYEQIFDRVNVVVPESKVDSLISLIGKNVGIIVLTDSYTLSNFRDPLSNLDRLSHEKVFSCLRKKEYEEIIFRKFGELPVVKPVYVRRAALELFKTLKQDEIQQEFISCLKARKISDKTKEIVKNLPKSLSSLGLLSDFSNLGTETYIEVLNSKLKN